MSIGPEDRGCDCPKYWRTGCRVAEANDLLLQHSDKPDKASAALADSMAEADRLRGERDECVKQMAKARNKCMDALCLADEESLLRLSAEEERDRCREALRPFAVMNGEITDADLARARAALEGNDAD